MILTILLLTLLAALGGCCYLIYVLDNRYRRLLAGHCMAVNIAARQETLLAFALTALSSINDCIEVEIKDGGIYIDHRQILSHLRCFEALSGFPISPIAAAVAEAGNSDE